jgi:hypothetical protein
LKERCSLNFVLSLGALLLWIGLSASAQSANGLRFADGPADAIAIVNSALKNPPFIQGHPLLVNFDALRILPPLARYNLLIPETVDGKLSVQAEGWEYLVRSNAQSVQGVAAVSVRTTSAGTSQMMSLQYENVAGPEVRALDQLATVEQIGSGSYEVRLLQVFGLVGNLPVQVFWLKAESGDADLFYEPLSPNPNLFSKLQFEKLYSKEEFLKVARGNPPGSRGTAPPR